MSGEWLTGDYLTDSSHPNWDVAPDGRFLMLKRAGAEAQTIVVHNWGASFGSGRGRGSREAVADGVAGKP